MKMRIVSIFIYRINSQLNMHISNNICVGMYLQINEAYEEKFLFNATLIQCKICLKCSTFL